MPRRFLGRGPSSRVSYRNAYKRAAVEDARALITAQTQESVLQIKAEVERQSSDFVRYYGTEQIFPKKTGNLLDSFGVGIYKGGALMKLYSNDPIATKPVRTGFMGLDPVDQVESRNGNVWDLISGANELAAMSASPSIGAAKLTPHLKTTNTLMAIMFIAAPYARAVHEKGYGFNAGPINKYYEVLEYNFEHTLVAGLQDLYPNYALKGRTKYRQINNMPNSSII